MFEDTVLKWLGNSLKDKLNEKAEIYCQENNYSSIDIVNTVIYSAIPLANIQYPVLQLYRQQWSKGYTKNVLTSTIRLQYSVTSANMEQLGDALNWIAVNIIEAFKELQIENQSLGNTRKLDYMDIQITSSLTGSVVGQATYPYLTALITIQE